MGCPHYKITHEGKVTTIEINVFSLAQIQSAITLLLEDDTKKRIQIDDGISVEPDIIIFQWSNVDMSIPPMRIDCVGKERKI